jgi:hypothetical protein
MGVKMFTKKNLISILVIALLVAVGYPARADDTDLLDNAYKTVTGTWDGLSDFVGGILGGQSDDFESAPRMESPKPKPQAEYRYVPRHTTGYPKWIRQPAR